MGEQLAKRATLEWIEYILEQFNERALSEKQACQLLEIKRIQLYELRKRWLRAKTVVSPRFRRNFSYSGQFLTR